MKHTFLALTLSAFLAPLAIADTSVDTSAPTADSPTHHDFTTTTKTTKKKKTVKRGNVGKLVKTKEETVNETTEGTENKSGAESTPTHQ